MGEGRWGEVGWGGEGGFGVGVGVGVGAVLLLGFCCCFRRNLSRQLSTQVSLLSFVLT